MLVIALPASAAAQSPTPTNDGYEDSSITYVGGSGDSADPGSSTNSGGSLPFSGLDLALVGGLGVGLVLLGVGMRRATRGPHPA